MNIAKVIELIGDSDKSWDDAACKAIADASKTITNISGLEMMSATASVKNGKITNYKACVKIAFDLIDR